MNIEELGIKGLRMVRSPIHIDNRGFFREWFNTNEIEAKLGCSFEVKQANTSSANAGVVRGIHHSLILGSQGKWITCTSGVIWDVVVDIRPSSPIFKKWVVIKLDSSSGDTLMISEGPEHRFLVLAYNSNIVFLLTSLFPPTEEFGIHPLYPDLATKWPIKNISLSSKDSAAPSLRKQFVSRKF